MAMHRVDRQSWSAQMSDFILVDGPRVGKAWAVLVAESLQVRPIALRLRRNKSNPMKKFLCPTI
jgi:hypothetical protein